MKKKKVLFILHMPPPVHGAAMIGQYIHDSRPINTAFDCRYINLSLANSLHDIGKASIKKLFDYMHQLWLIRREARRFSPHLVYVTPNAEGQAFYKDYVVVQMLKHMGFQVVVHYHNKGVANSQDKFFDNLLYRRFFKHLKVILLARSLYDDVKKYVKPEDVMYCPNGIPDMQS